MKAPRFRSRGPTPLYEQIASRIRDRIACGEWPVDFQLRAEEDLAKEMRVSRGTLRRALRDLVRRHILVQVPMGAWHGSVGHLKRWRR